MDEHCTQDYANLDVAIRFANDLTELGYIRPDLLHAIGSCGVKLTAQNAVRRISNLFKGHFPAQMNRASERFKSLSADSWGDAFETRRD